MNCQEYQKMMMSGHDTAARQAHLRDCPACRAFARSHEVLLQAKPSAEPSPALDAAVQRLAREWLTSHPAHRVPSGWRLLTGHYRIVTAAAALLLASGLAVVYYLTPPVALPQLPVVATVPAQINWGDATLEASLQSLDQALGEFNRNPAGLPTAVSNGETIPSSSLDRVLQEIELDLYLEMDEDIWNIPMSQKQPTPNPRRIA